MPWPIEKIEQAFLTFMAENGHAVIEAHSLRSPTDDVLFTTAGMHPLTPYFAGEPHPAGRRLADVQRCVRTTDVDEVGDNTHLTVFDMLGNWSLGDYGEEVAIRMSFQLLTEEFGIDPDRLYVTVFAGDGGVPADETSPSVWAELFAGAGLDPAGRIRGNGAEDNWWSNGPVGLCGPDTEIFFYVGDEPAPAFTDRPEFVEIWNNVFMNYTRSADGTLYPLEQRNVDTGMGLERTSLILNGHTSVWQTDELAAISDGVAAVLGVDPATLDASATRSLHIVCDHVRAALAIAAAGVYPAATRHGYVLRKLTRRAVRHAELLTGTDKGLRAALSAAAESVSQVMGARWPDIGDTPSGDAARGVIDAEAAKFAKSLRHAVKHLHELAAEGADFDGELAFRLADARGYPPELSVEEAERIGMRIDPGWPDELERLRAEQRERSRG